MDTEGDELMYLVGANVVHPNYGAGRIVSIERKHIAGVGRRYYVIRSEQEGRPTYLMVPVIQAEVLGLRPVGVAAQLRGMLSACGQVPVEMAMVTDYRARKILVTEMLKSGSFKQVSSAMRVLFFISDHRRLGVADRELLDHGTQLLASELALASGDGFTEAKREVQQRLIGGMM